MGSSHHCFCASVPAFIDFVGFCTLHAFFSVRMLSLWLQHTFSLVSADPDNQKAPGAEYDGEAESVSHSRPCKAVGASRPSHKQRTILEAPRWKTTLLPLKLGDPEVGVLGTAEKSFPPTRGNRLSHVREGWQPSSSRTRGVCGVLPGTDFAFSGTRYLLFQKRSFQSRPSQPFYPDKTWLSLTCLEPFRPCLYELHEGQ